MWKLNRTSGRWPLLVTLVIALAACSGGMTRVESDLGMDDAPDWVNEGSQVLDDQGGRLFHGIGSAPPMGDDSLQRSTADERARAALARVLGSYLEVVSADYVTSEGEKEAEADVSLSREIKNVTRRNLVGAKIIARWRNPENGDIWSLAELDLDHLKATLEADEAMDAGFKRFLEGHADRVFDRLREGRP